MQHSKHQRMFDAVFFVLMLFNQHAETDGSRHFDLPNAPDCRVYVSYGVLVLTRQLAVLLVDHSAAFMLLPGLTRRIKLPGGAADAKNERRYNDTRHRKMMRRH